ncbi:hypothetical protein FQA47_014551 [Oryzias melastigma]|uniref:Uncharacterized protein n=1 Tax=Oryzias melastigma TaxID=30732 RepID=A0A834FLM0_ORYME|nr:hypothetical protein FQA47_014551 [Oryzias melastigma]
MFYRTSIDVQDVFAFKWKSINFKKYNVHEKSRDFFLKMLLRFPSQALCHMDWIRTISTLRNHPHCQPDSGNTASSPSCSDPQQLLRAEGPPSIMGLAGRRKSEC